MSCGLGTCIASLLGFESRFAGWSFVKCQMSGFFDRVSVGFGLFSLGVYIVGDIFGQRLRWDSGSW